MDKVEKQKWEKILMACTRREQGDKNKTKKSGVVED